MKDAPARMPVHWGIVSASTPRSRRYRGVNAPRCPNPIVSTKLAAANRPAVHIPRLAHRTGGSPPPRAGEENRGENPQGGIKGGAPRAPGGGGGANPPNPKKGGGGGNS